MMRHDRWVNERYVNFVSPGTGWALEVTTDELLGVIPRAQTTSAKTARLVKRLKKIEALPTVDQRAVLKFLDALLKSRGMTPTSGRSLNQNNG